MSNLSAKCENETNCLNRPNDIIEKLIPPKEKDLGGFSVRRLLPYKDLAMVGPWIFFDHMGPADFPANDGINVRPHPHINLATVSYLFEGEMYHRDSLGNSLAISPGAINLMVAGKGIVHSERERPEIKSVAHRLHGLQLWQALPEEFEECEPAFYHHPANEIPQIEENGVPIRVMIGKAYGVESPVKTFCETLYAEATLKTGQRIALPQATELAIYIVEGELKQGSAIIPCYHLAKICTDNYCELTATQPTKIAIIGGEPLGKRFIYWNFVSSRKDRIQQAMKDWQDLNYSLIAEDNKEYIPLPD